LCKSREQVPQSSAHRQHFRIDDGKQNLVPPSNAAVWCKLESVLLGNNTFDRPADHIGVATPWQWPGAFEGLPEDALLKAQQAVDGGQWRENVQATDWVGKPIAEALGLDYTEDKEQVKVILKAWLADGSFVVVEGEDDRRNPRKFVQVGRWAPKD
jgi:hypothetical protein